MLLGQKYSSLPCWLFICFQCLNLLKGFGIATSFVGATKDSSKIPVEIRLNPAPNQLHGKLYVTTGTNYTVIAEITDEHYKNLTLTYQWSVKDKTITTDPNASQIFYQFKQPEDSDFIKVLVVHSTNETGMMRKDLVVYDPVAITEFKCDSVLTQGDLLNATIKFSGTRPVRYSYKICPGIHVNPDCIGFRDGGTTNDISVTLVHYLRFVGDYTLMFGLMNTASNLDKSYHIKIVDTVRNQSIPYTPIVCSIAAVLVLAIGLIMHLKFKRTIYTETADLDFTRNAYEDDDDWADQWESEQSFMQRVKYLLLSDGRADQTSQSISSILNGSRSRLV